MDTPLELSPEELERLRIASKKFTEAFNELSNQFIKFSLAYNSVQEQLRPIFDRHPTLFDNKENND